TITATTNDGSFTDTATITVQTATVPVTGVTVTPSSETLNVGDNASLTATVSPANATDTSVVWSTSNPEVATVSTNGTVTAIGAGTTTITATTNDGSFTDNIEVSVISDEGIILYPNPTTNLVYIKIPSKQIELSPVDTIGLYEISGKLILEYSNQFTTETLFPMDIPEVQTGIYLLKINYKDDSSVTKKIILGN
uniref:Ig-like domain-containing protein n=1 Tax=Maribacter flavus TaxID=1658664 RepID=UPI003D34A8B7